MAKRWIPLVLAMSFVGCGVNSRVHTAIDEYQARDYPTALGDLKNLEDYESPMAPRWYVRYLVFRGLSHFRVWRTSHDDADLSAARRFLTRGKSEYEHGDRTFLTAAEDAELSAAIESLKSAE